MRAKLPLVESDENDLGDAWIGENQNEGKRFAVSRWLREERSQDTPVL
jgi:hypothetical protein